MTVVEAVKTVLSQSADSLTAQEIYTLITQRNLYQFAAKDPVHVVVSMLRRHCQGLDFPSASPMKYFQIGQIKRGKTTYTLLNTNIPLQQQRQQKSDKEKLPEEIILSAYFDHCESVKSALLEKILANDPSFFEHLVLKLFLNMGYGYSLESGIVTGGPYDQGIDGVIFEDELKFSQIQFQAKRYAANHAVREKELREFIGAMQASESGVNKGAFITTSYFDKNALTYEKRIASSKNLTLKLIDGHQLVDLMLKHKIGVTVSETFSTYIVDTDYFSG